MAGLGAIMESEILEQPTMLARVLRDGRTSFAAAAHTVRARQPRFILLAARGTSDHAALYLKYLLEVRLGIPTGLASPSTVTAYGAQPDLHDVLVIALSQSGASPDLVGVIESAREHDAITLAMTNSPGSPLSTSSEFHLDVLAGPEHAVAATKSYTAELLAAWLFVDAWAGGDGEAAHQLPGIASALLGRRDDIATLAERYRFTDRILLTGRGYSYATAREAALKMMETSYLPALAFSGADLLHGPSAMIDSGLPVLAIAPEGLGSTALRPVLELLHERGAHLTVVGGPSSLALGTASFDVGHHLPEELAPIVDILPLQLLALQMAVGRGHDPDAPRGLSKQTQTW